MPVPYAFHPEVPGKAVPGRQEAGICVLSFAPESNLEFLKDEGKLLWGFG